MTNSLLRTLLLSIHDDVYYQLASVQVPFHSRCDVHVSIQVYTDQEYSNNYIFKN